MSPSHLRRALVAVVVTAAATILPIRTAWSAPAVRLDELAADPGEVVDLTHPSSHLGVRWIGEETDALQVRWRGEAARWSSWIPVEVAHDLGDEDADVRLSGLIVTEDAVDAQVRVLAGSPDDIEVVAIDTEHGPRRLVVAKPNAGAQVLPTTTTTSVPTTSTTAKPSEPAPVAQPAIISRAQWGADESMKGSDPPAFGPITRLALHHTAGGEDADPAATVRAIYAYHTKSNGWNDIGYNFLVDSAGRIYEGRYSREYARGEVPTGETTDKLGVTGAHIAGNNTGTVGVSLLGNFSGDSRPTNAAVSAAEKVFAWKADRHDIDLAANTS